jgi:uncharacterized protein (TIGR02246 family)
MKMRSIVAVVGLAISFALPTFAQQKETVDPQIIEQLDALAKKFMEFINNNDATAVAAVFTEDAVFVTPQGPVYGREAIEKFFADAFKQVHFSNHLAKADSNSIRFIDTAGNEVWRNGELVRLFKARTSGLYKKRAIGQRLRFVRAMLGSIGCAPLT